MAPPVVRNDAVAMLPEEQHLPIPVIRGQGPTMRKHDRLALSPILVVDLRAVFGRNRRPEGGVFLIAVNIFSRDSTEIPAICLTGP